MLSLATTQQKKVTILVVEDDEDILVGIRDFLEAADIIIDDVPLAVNILTAKDGQAAVDLLEDHAPDLIISDVMMPRVTGYELLENVLSRPELLHTPFIFLTAKNATEDEHKGLLKGASLYLTKPFDTDTLLQHISSQLKKSFARQSVQDQYFDSFKKQMLKILNHEFRTPLTYVTAYYEMLAYRAEAQGTLEDYQEYLRGIQTGCVRLTNLIEDFMLVIDLNSGEAKSIYLNQSELIGDINTVIKQAVEQCEALLKETAVTFTLNLGQDLPTIVGVRHQLLTILVRVIDNAIKFSKNSGRTPHIEITTRTENDELHISIKDNGHGMPSHTVEKIFDLFFQYNRDTQEQQGAGTGLTIAAGLVDLHLGRILVETEDGKGSQFTLVFPENRRLSTNTVNPDKDRAVILAIEDDPNLLDGLQDLLETIEGKYELDVLKARNGLEGIEQLRKQLPDLIISDIMMPKMSGYDFLQEVRQKPEWLHIPIIFLTAKGKSPDKHKAYIMGVDEYITKPYESDLLLRYVESQLDRRFHVQKMLDHNFDLLKRSILSMITPNFQQPLSFVTQYVDEMTNSVSDVQTVDEFKQSLQGIKTGSEWLHRVIEDFMILAELKTGEADDAFRLQSQPIPNIGVVLSEFSVLHSARFAAENIELCFDPFDTQLPSIHGNIAQLSSSFSRLIEVGIKQAAVGDETLKIGISVVEDEGEVVVTIRFKATLPDNVAQTVEDILSISGTQEEMFRSFEYAPDLSIAQGYVSLHKGTITLTRPGSEGFNFTMRLPIAQ